MANSLTAKEVSMLADLLTYEESACKKTRAYAKTLTNPRLSGMMDKLADSHERRFNALFELL